MQGSDIADTVLALFGIEMYATKDQLKTLATTRRAAEKWLAQAALITQEDRIWRLWGLHYLKSDLSAKEAVRSAILAA
ncbi:hypothetical protein U2071_15735, partial [Listeria monocytogenes]|uniref:hypothetical protein n=1 Tax=Listeria monocytogenes TaxID=1639 RepID=UPI002FDBE1E2